MRPTLPNFLKPLSLAYRLAKQKREFESYLRAQGWTKRDALKAVAEKFAPGGSQQ